MVISSLLGGGYTRRWADTPPPLPPPRAHLQPPRRLRSLKGDSRTLQHHLSTAPSLDSSVVGIQTRDRQLKLSQMWSSVIFGVSTVWCDVHIPHVHGGEETSAWGWEAMSPSNWFSESVCHAGPLGAAGLWRRLAAGVMRRDKDPCEARRAQLEPTHQHSAVVSLHLYRNNKLFRGVACPSCSKPGSCTEKDIKFMLFF